MHSLRLMLAIAVALPSIMAQVPTPGPSKDNKQPAKQTQSGSLPYTIHEQLQDELQTLSDDFIDDFSKHYHSQQGTHPVLNLTAVKHSPGQYLLLVAKMYLYQQLPLEDYHTENSFMMAYFYFKIAARKYEHPEAYYWLGILEYHRLTPDQTLLINLRENSDLTPGQNWTSKLIKYLSTSHVVNAEHNLYMASLLGHNGASLMLATMNKEGIGMAKNCTLAAVYYLSVVKKTYLDHYEFRSPQSSKESFEYELYAKKKINLDNMGNNDLGFIEDTDYIDEETKNTMLELAANYFVGRGGYVRNYTKSMQLYAKMAAQKHQYSISMLAMGYFKGQGLPLDRVQAKKLFQESKNVDISDYMLTAMKYFGLEGAKAKQEARATLLGKFQKREQKPLKPLYKYLIGSIIAKGEFPEISKIEGYVLLEESAAHGNVMAKVVMGLLYLDGEGNLPFDCQRAISYFAIEAIENPIFMVNVHQIQDKPHLAKIGIKKKLFQFSLMKYLELSMVGNEEAFVNTLYLLEVYKEALKLHEKSWSVSSTQDNIIYKALLKQHIVPDIQDTLREQFCLLGCDCLKGSRLDKSLAGSPKSLEEYRGYMLKKIIKISSSTKANSFVRFYQYKIGMKKDADPVGLLKSIASGNSEKAHVLEARYLLAKNSHRKLLQNKSKLTHAQKYQLLKDYSRAAKSDIIGEVIFYIEEYSLGRGDSLLETFLQTDIVQSFLAYTFCISIVCFVMYYLRSTKLDEIHRAAVQAQAEQARQAFIEQELQRKLRQNSEQSESGLPLDPNQPIITEDRNGL